MRGCADISPPWPVGAARRGFCVVLASALPGARPTVRRWPARTTSWLGFLAVLSATILWGYSNVVMRQLDAPVTPGLLMWLRYAIPLAVCGPVLARVRGAGPWFAGAVGAGAVLGLATYAQAAALETIPVDQMAFVSALYVVFTPLAVAVMARRLPPWTLLGATLAALLGVVLLMGGLGGGVRVGTWLALASAGALTVQILALSRLAVRASPLQLTAAESLGAVLALTVVVAMHAGPALAVLQQAPRWPLGVWAGVLYLALGGGLLAYVLQAWGQRHLSAAAAALVFNTEAVWSALLAWWVLAEALTGWRMAGAALTLGTLTMAVLAGPRPGSSAGVPPTGPGE